MKTAHSLFELIQTLSPAEKGYFKRYVQHSDGKPKIYVRLFDAINGQKIYDEALLKQKFGKEISNFSAAKIYLYDNILDSLTNGNRRHSIFSEAIDYLLKAEILSSRLLFSHALEHLDKLEQLAEQNYEPALNIFAFDRRLMIATVEYDQAELQRLMEEGIDRANEWIEDLKTDILVRRTVTWLTLFRMNSPALSIPRERAKFLKRAKEYADQLKHRKLKPFYRITLEQMNYIIAEENGKIADGYRHIRNILTIIESPEIVIPGIENNRVACLWNAGMYSLHHYPADVVSYVNRLQEFIDRKDEPTCRTAATMAEQFRYALLIRYYNLSGEFERSELLLSEILKWIEENKMIITSRVLSQFNFDAAYHYFATGKFQKSMQYLQRIYENKECDRNSLLSSLVLEMVIQYESSDLKYIKGVAKQLQKLLLEYEMKNTFYQKTFDCFTKLLLSKNRKETEQLLSKMLESIEVGGSQLKARKPSLMRVLLPWLTSRRDGITFQEAIKKLYDRKVGNGLAKSNGLDKPVKKKKPISG
ncbi:MAG: hypothetical protein IPP77_13630 [Bacteroidetes bacterium]|nr:hypothetical protein [Bacteroidota bacterium]